LTICKLSDCSASVAGGREIILLCEKVAKEDIQVRFYEEIDGEVTWEGQGDFTPTQVHKQVAISFRTPKYKVITVENAVKVWVQLRRPSDGATSESVPFKLTPLEEGRPTFWSLHRALLKKGGFGMLNEVLVTQKRKLEPDPDEEAKNTKDSLISGGDLVTLPPPPITVFEIEPKVLGLEITQTIEPKNIEPEPEIDIMDVDETSKDEAILNHDFLEKDVLNDGNSFDGVIDKSKENSLDEYLAKEKDENSFDDLITQVAELDEIYSDARNRLQMENAPMNCPELFDDSQTYTSLQLAMKNPIHVSGPYEDVTPVQSPVISVAKSPNEKLPPLPPKRAKQVPPGRPDHSPVFRTLPRTPEKGKGTIFSKLFSRKKSDKVGSTESFKITRKTSLDEISAKSDKGIGKWFHRGSTGSLVEQTVDSEPKEPPKEEEFELDLTEAENYALYTTTAPHASVSEFDEISSYYSPVEGGRILNDFRVKPQNVTS